MDSNKRQPGEDASVDEELWRAMSPRPAAKQEKKRRSLIVPYAIIGLLLGLLLGIFVLNHIAAGVVVGLCLGYGMGTMADIKGKRR